MCKRLHPVWVRCSKYSLLLLLYIYIITKCNYVLLTLANHHTEKTKLSTIQLVTTWMCDCYIHGFAPKPKFLWSQKLCADSIKVPQKRLKLRSLV